MQQSMSSREEAKRALSGPLRASTLFPRMISWERAKGELRKGYRFLKRRFRKGTIKGINAEKICAGTAFKLE
eukprot:1141113-Pelagomonas_calceolata.AAC.2